MHEQGHEAFEVAVPFWKARPFEESGKRLIFCEPSTETRDIAGEKVLRRALLGSREYFLKHGNIDIEHRSIPSVAAKLNIPTPRDYEIGRPVELTDDLLLKAQLYRGAEQADKFWQSLHYDPPMPWFPSVGGLMFAKDKDGAITKALWGNVGFSNWPVNADVKPASLTPELFLKAITGMGGTDTASLTGGAALRRESLAGDEDDDFDANSLEILKAIEAGQVAPYPGHVAHEFQRRGVAEHKAGHYAERFFRKAGRAVLAKRQSAALAA